jgi:hypothetical protein
MVDSLLVCVVHTNANYLVGLRLPFMKALRARACGVVALAPNMSREHVEALANTASTPSLAGWTPLE